MDKSILIRKIESGNHSKEQLLTWVRCLPGISQSRKPTESKVGDVYMRPVFKHPYVLLENRNDHWLCGLLTSESTCPEILVETQSRFFTDKYITKVLFTASELTGSFLNPYDNNKHLKKVLKNLKEILE